MPQETIKTVNVWGSVLTVLLTGVIGMGAWIHSNILELKVDVAVIKAQYEIRYNNNSKLPITPTAFYYSKEGTLPKDGTVER